MRFSNFRHHAICVYALGPDNRVYSAAALAEVVAGKDGLEPSLATIVTAALAQRDRPARKR